MGAVLPMGEGTHRGAIPIKIGNAVWQDSYFL
jgi:hypothetical protein